MNNLDIIRTLPAKLDDAKRVWTACYISTVMGECEATMGEPWEVLWSNHAGPWGVWLSPHGVYVSDDTDIAKTYAILGYCAYHDIPAFTDQTVLQLNNAREIPDGHHRH